MFWVIFLSIVCWFIFSALTTKNVCTYVPYVGIFFCLQEVSRGKFVNASTFLCTWTEVNPSCYGHKYLDNKRLYDVFLGVFFKQFFLKFFFNFFLWCFHNLFRCHARFMPSTKVKYCWVYEERLMHPIFKTIICATYVLCLQNNFNFQCAATVLCV